MNIMVCKVEGPHKWVDGLWGEGFPHREETRKHCQHLVGLVKCDAKTRSVYKNCRFETNSTMDPMETMQISKIGM